MNQRKWMSPCFTSRTSAFGSEIVYWSGRYSGNPMKLVIAIDGKIAQKSHEVSKHFWELITEEYLRQRDAGLAFKPRNMKVTQ